MWLRVEGFKDLIRNWWQGIEVKGSASFKLAAKLKEMKQILKDWNRNVFGNLESNKAAALHQVEYWDLVESERSLTEEETEAKKVLRRIMLSGSPWKKPIGDSCLGSYG
ncbi:hypothetical protein CK203_017208 [Vitis vinifera]|uniref:Uncharacterized protein n=1 Tax=Vitis vinifera TaxID=29760 RepID=A0A438JZD8_VITVI|nr:hypothetical protein CK203_017208 [Vitis vinifera]